LALGRLLKTVNVHNVTHDRDAARGTAPRL
jgi:hypothetical protein